jgi:hypothetical protein
VSRRLGRLRLFHDWACRQLQYRSPLPRSEVSNENDGAVREFESVVMLVRFVGVDLAKPRCSYVDTLAKHRAASLNVMFECELGPGTMADRDFWAVRARKAPSPSRLEFG